MFETSFRLATKAILLNIILPLIPGILTLRICFWKKFEGTLLYLLSRFVGVGVVAFSLFNLQFIHLGIGVAEYFIILWVLILIFIGKLLIQKEEIKEYSKTLIIKNNTSEIKQSFKSLSKIEKIFTIVIAIFALWFVSVNFIKNVNFPTYGDDSFTNRNGTAYNIYQDDGVKIFGDKSEILWRGARLWYPVYIPTYKATISEFLGWFNDIYINLWQRLVFIWLLLFVWKTSFDRTKNIFHSLLPIGLIISLPLVFFHAGEGYMELGSAMYSILTIRALSAFLETKDYSYISLGLLFGFILSYIKNDGFVVYLPAILLTFIGVLLIEKRLKKDLIWFAKSGINIVLSGLYFLFFFVPFLAIKSYYNLWFNQASGAESGAGISTKIHREIFSVFGSIFTKIDNYNVVLIILLIGIWIIIKKWKWLPWSDKFLAYAPLMIFVVLILVFLLTENYLFALDQTTINRVFTVAFIIFFSFSWYLLAKRWDD